MEVQSRNFVSKQKLLELSRSAQVSDCLSHLSLTLWSLPLVLFAKAPKSEILNIVEMLGGLDCSKSYLLDFAKSCLV